MARKLSHNDVQAVSILFLYCRRRAGGAAPSVRRAFRPGRDRHHYHFRNLDLSGRCLIHFSGRSRRGRCWWRGFDYLRQSRWRWRRRWRCLQFCGDGSARDELHVHRWCRWCRWQWKWGCRRCLGLFRHWYYHPYRKWWWWWCAEDRCWCCGWFWWHCYRWCGQQIWRGWRCFP